MSKKHIAIIVVGALAIAGGSFYGGMKYNQSASIAASEGAGGFANLTPEQRQARLASFGTAGGARGARGGGGGAASGQVIAKDDKSITVKLANGGSMIIFYSGSTTVSKNAAGTLSDITPGTEISAFGTPNQDGSVTAESIQIRPATQQGQ